MKIRISKDWWDSYVMGQPGKTQSVKETNAEHIFSGPGRSWGKSMNEFAGKWVTVETEHLFSDQFNVVEGNLRVHAKHIDGIDFGPEFENLDEFRAAVQKRYDTDWPGRKAQCGVITSYIKSKFIEVVCLKYSLTEMREICKPLSIHARQKWGNGFIVNAPDEETIHKLEPKGFKVRGIGVGYDYNEKVVTLYAERRV